MTNNASRNFWLDWGGILSILAAVAGIAFYFTHEIRRDLMAIEATREELSRRLEDRRVDHDVIKAQQLDILSRLGQIESKISRTVDGKKGPDDKRPGSGQASPTPETLHPTGRRHVRTDRLSSRCGRIGPPALGGPGFRDGLRGRLGGRAIAINTHVSTV